MQSSQKSYEVYKLAATNTTQEIASLEAKLASKEGLSFLRVAGKLAGWLAPPVAGFFVSFIFDAMWPPQKQLSPDEMFQAMKSQIQKLIDDSIHKAMLSNVRKSLQGLEGVVQDYLKILQTGDKEAIRTKFAAAESLFIHDTALFKDEDCTDCAWMLVSLYPQFASMHLLLLRDGVSFGKDWGWSDTLWQHYSDELTARIKEHTNHLNKVARDQLKALTKKAPTSSGKDKIDIYNYWSEFHQQKTLSVDDFVELFKYLDLKVYPQKVDLSILHFKDVFTEAIGTASNFDGIAQNYAFAHSAPEDLPKILKELKDERDVPADTLTKAYKDGVGIVYYQPMGPIKKIEIETRNNTPRVLYVSYDKGQGPRLTHVSEKTNDSVQIIANSLQDEAALHDVRSIEIKDGLVKAKVKVAEGRPPFGLELETSKGDKYLLWDRKQPAPPPPPAKPVYFGMYPAAAALGQMRVEREYQLRIAKEPKFSWKTYEIPGRRLTTFNLWTRSKNYDDCLGCMILGFSYDPNYISKETLDRSYVINPNKELAKADLAFYGHVVDDKTKKRRKAFQENVLGVKEDEMAANKQSEQALSKSSYDAGQSTNKSST